VGDQLGPVGIAMGVGLDMAGAVGLVQGVRVLVDDGVLAAGIKVFGDLKQGIDASGGFHYPVGGASAPGQGASSG
jgi:hypothetical protein